MVCHPALGCGVAALPARALMVDRGALGPVLGLGRRRSMRGRMVSDAGSSSRASTVTAVAVAPRGRTLKETHARGGGGPPVVASAAGRLLLRVKIGVRCPATTGSSIPYGLATAAAHNLEAWRS
jgi:hypothetical protein